MNDETTKTPMSHVNTHTRVDDVDTIGDVDDVDLISVLRDDPLFKKVCQAVPPDQRERIESLVFEFMTGIQEGTIGPMLKMMREPLFVETFMNIMMKRRDRDGEFDIDPS